MFGRGPSNLRLAKPLRRKSGMLEVLQLQGWQALPTALALQRTFSRPMAGRASPSLAHDNMPTHAVRVLARAGSAGRAR